MVAAVSGSEQEDGDETLTTCRLCGNLMTDPRMLPCLHTFCLRCLEDRLITGAPSTSHHVTCPQCRDDFPLPVGGLCHLPVNIFFARLAERRRAANGQVNNNNGNVFPYSLPSVGPGADPGVQAVSPQVT